MPPACPEPLGAKLNPLVPWKTQPIAAAGSAATPMVAACMELVSSHRSRAPGKGLASGLTSVQPRGLGSSASRAAVMGKEAPSACLFWAGGAERDIVSRQERGL